MFLERVYEGKNDIGRWIAMILILLIITQFIGGIPLGILIFLKMSDNPDLEPNPENLLDLTAYGISPISGLMLMIIPFVLGLITLVLLMKPIHERPVLSVMTGFSRFRWKRFFWGALVWLILMIIYESLAILTGLQTVEFQFNPQTLLTLAAVSVLLLPFQAGFEELIFRGYLMQGFAKVFKYKWIALVITAILFGSLHFMNPEIKEYGAAIMMPQYIWFGIFFGICALMDEGLELAWGIHAINNIFLSVFFTQDSSALQTPALSRITAFNPVTDLVSLFILTLIFIFFAHKRLSWPEWNYLLAKITPQVPNEEDAPEYFEDEYDEYNEE